MVDEKEFDFVAQLSHLGWGIAVVLLADKLFHRAASMAILWIIYAAIKEFYWDYKYETPEVRGSSAKDYLFQVLGALIGILACVLF